MDSISINKTLNFENGSIEIRYQGQKKNKNVDQDKIQSLLDKFIEKNNHNNMLENVAIVRTILRDYEEKLLVIFYQDEKGTELVKYDNSNMFLYEKSKNDEEDKYKEKYRIKYESPYGIKLDYKNNESDLSDYNDIKLISEEISEIMEHIYSLKKVKAIELDADSKALIEIYKLFYNENPDFSNKNIHIKVQTMMSILAEFGISLKEDYSFNIFENSKMPLSLYLEQKINYLFPLGKVDEVEEPISLTAESKRIIKIVGEYIRESIKASCNKEEALITISQIIYAGRYNLSSNSNIKEISEFTENPSPVIESSIRLVKNIKKKIDQENI